MKKLAMLLVVVLGLLSLDGAAAKKSAPAPYTSLTREFADFYDSTTTIPGPERVVLFRKRFNTLFPGFYAPADGQSDEQFDKSVARALENFPKLRPDYERTERDFARVYAEGIRHFRTQFPGFRPVLPVWFVHSLGRMDGGTRTYNGKTYMIFGADVIARIHDSKDIGPFLDHEMFHVENGQWFKDCDPMWCSLWQEGLATYAASVMNPGADDHLLMLDNPKPIRAAVDADWRKALCMTKGDLDSSDQPVYSRYFFGQDDPKRIFPARWGYYVGLRIMQRLGKHYTLRQLDRMDQTAAKPVLTRELDAMIAEAGGCPT